MKKPIEVAVIHPDGRVEKKSLVADLEPLQKEVGGYIQQLKLAPGIWAWVHEEGKLEGLPVNPKATAFCHVVGPNIAADDYIVGPMVVTGPGGNQSVTTRTWEIIQALTIKELK